MTGADMPLDRVDDENVPRWERLFVRFLRQDLRTIADLGAGDRDDTSRELHALPADIDEAAQLVTTVLSTQFRELADRGWLSEAAVLWGWRDVLTYGWSPTAFFQRNAQFFADSDEGRWIGNEIPKHDDPSTRLARFLGTDGQRLRPSARQGLRSLTLAIYDALEERRERITRVPPASRAEALHARDELLSTGMAAALDREGRDKAIVTAVQCRAFPRLAEMVDRRESMLVVGPPGCGKTLIGRVAAAHAASSPEGKSLILFPTRALVRENRDSWVDWTSQDDSGRTWNVIAGSRDDREYDERLGSGDYDIGVCVYEKVRALLLVNPSALRDVRLLVIDELQYINDDERGARLETLLSLIRLRYPDLPMLALTGPLMPESRRNVASWLGITHVVTSDARTTDLIVNMSDSGVTWSRREYGIDPRGPVPDAEPRPPDTKIAKKQHLLNQKSKALRLELRSGNRSRRRMLALLARILTEGSGDPRVICFVKTRRDAFELARAASGVFPKPVARKGNPWETGRFASSLTLAASDITDRFAELKDYVDLDGYSDVLRGLDTGVAYHTADLGPELRGLLEREFTSGIIRVLFATDTLAEGVNLPASHVIVGDLVTMRRVGDELVNVPIELARLRNRIGRAGRLLAGSEVGEAHIVLDTELKEESLVATARSHIDELRVLDKAWARWVNSGAIGLQLMSRLAADAEGRHALALDAIVSLKQPTPRSQFERLIDEAFRATFYATTMSVSQLAAQALEALLEGPLVERVDPIAEAVQSTRDALLATGTVAPAEDDPEMLVVTPLGVSVSRFALRVSSAPQVQDLADVAQRAVGPLALLFHAAHDSSLDRVGGFNWPRPTPDHRDPETVLRYVQTWAGAYAATTEALRDQRAAQMRILPPGTPDDDPTAPLPAPVELPGDLLERAAPIHAQDSMLADWATDSGSENPNNPVRAEETHRHAVALLRAVVSLEWSAAEPFDHIMLRYSAPRTQVMGWQGTKKRGYNTKEPLQRRSMESLRQLVERIAQVLEPAGLLIHEDQDAASRLKALARELQHGLPAWLFPLADLHVRGLGRERLVRAAKAGRTPPIPLSDVLDWRELGLSENVRRRARDRIDERLIRDRAVYAQVSRELRNASSPIPTHTYSDLHYDIVNGADASASAAAVVLALRAHRIRPSGTGVFASLPLWPTVEIANGAWTFVIADLDNTTTPTDWVVERRMVLLPLQLPTEHVQRLISEMPYALLAPRALIQLLYHAWTAKPIVDDESMLGAVTGTLGRLATGELTNVAGLQELLAELEETTLGAPRASSA